MTQGMGGYPLFQLGEGEAVPDHLPYSLSAHPVPPAVHDEPAAILPLEEHGTHGQYVIAQKAADPGAYRHHAVLVPLAPHQDEAAVKVEVGKPYPGQLGPPDAGVVKHLQDDAITVAPIAVGVGGGDEFSHVRLAHDGARQGLGLLGELEPCAGVVDQVVVFLEVAGERLDGAKPLRLAAYRQGPSLGGEAEGQLLLVLLQDFEGQLFEVGYSLLPQEGCQHLQDPLGVHHGMGREATGLHLLKVFRYQRGHVHLGGSPRGSS